MPRFEADAFAAAFIAAGKSEHLIRAIEDNALERFNAEYGPQGIYRNFGGGGVRMMPQGNPLEVAKTNCSDIEYRYEITAPKGQLTIKAYAVSCAWRDDQQTMQELLFEGPFDEFVTWAKIGEGVS